MSAAPCKIIWAPEGCGERRRVVIDVKAYVSSRVVIATAEWEAQASKYGGTADRVFVRTKQFCFVRIFVFANKIDNKIR